MPLYKSNFFLSFSCRCDAIFNAATSEKDPNLKMPKKTKGKSYARCHLWQVNISRKLREMGMNYIGQDGKERGARTVREPGCPETCSYECQKNFDSDERQNINRYFWSLNKHKKHEYYDQYVERVEPKRRRVTRPSRRGCTFRYFFALHDLRLQVCQKFFMNTLCISTSSVYWYFKKTMELSE